MKLLSGILLIVFLVFNTSVWGYQSCGNSASHQSDYCDCGGNSGDLFNSFTGDEHRETNDLEVWGGVGEIPLIWTRYSNSRFGSYYKYIYGDGSNWNSSFNYIMRDAEPNEQGRAQLFIHYPEGGGAYFAQSVSNPSVWLPLSSITERLFQDGNNFYLQKENGHRYHFQKFTLSTGNHYQLQDIRDNYQNAYRLTYDRYGFLSRITEPAGRYLDITYRVVATSYYLIGQVTSSDGRSVKYNYDVFDDGVASWVLLTEVNYGDGTKALYNYSQTEPGSRPSLAYAIDPRYTGKDVNMQFTYDPANAWGFIKEEINGVTGKVMATLSTETGKRTVCYANGRVQIYSMPDELLGLIKDYSDGLARKTYYTYNGSLPEQEGPGLIKTKTDALGRTTIYNQMTVYGHPLEITYADGSKEKWTRDELDQVLTHTDELGRTTKYTRDVRHRITRIDYEDGTKEQFSYNSFGQVVTHTHRNGGVETSVYDSRGLRMSFIDAVSSITRYTYDDADRLASVTDARGITSRNEYNERGLLIKAVNADGSFQTFRYDEFGSRISIINEIGNTWKTHYDEFKRRDSITDPLGRLTTYQYDLPNGVCGCSHDNELPTTIVSPSGRMTKIEYDVEWQMVSRTVGAGTVDAATTFYEYDLVGNLVTAIDPRIKSWTAEYDTRNRRKSFTDPLGHTIRWMYDGVGNVIQVVRPDDGDTAKVYDVMNRLVETTDSKGQVTKMKYDAEGNIIKITDAANNNYNFEFDLLNRKTRVIYPGGTFEQFIYDQVGNLATYTNRSNDVRTYTYDNRNREISSVWSDKTPAINRTYDKADRLISIFNTVSLLSYTYDDADEMKSEVQTVTGSSGTKIVEYTYNADGLRSSLIYPSGKVLLYTYSGRNQLAAISQGAAPLVSYSYDANGNLTRKKLYNNTNIIYSYDDADHTLSVDNQKNGFSFDVFTYGHDNTNRWTYVKRNNDKKDLFSYDPADQITGVSYTVADSNAMTFSLARKVDYDWDGVGNRINVNDGGTATHYVVNPAAPWSLNGGDLPIKRIRLGQTIKAL